MTAPAPIGLIEIPNEDCVPHDRATWRGYVVAIPGTAPEGVGPQRISIEYANGMIWHGYGDEARWHRVVRWRFGWPPR